LRGGTEGAEVAGLWSGAALGAAGSGKTIDSSDAGGGFEKWAGASAAGWRLTAEGAEYAEGAALESAVRRFTRLDFFQ